MTAQGKIKEGTEVSKPTGLELLRAPFPAHQISKLPKPTKRQTEEVRNDFKKGIRCEVCGAWHHPKVVHLDYVGHAALTDRLLDSDPAWNWEPVAINEDGTPKTDQFGGMWIKLTVCGVTRLGYGHPDGKTGGDAIKELIGDALRNAAMRFGAALDLWHKGDLHGIDDADDVKSEGEGQKDDRPQGPSPEAIDTAKQSLFNADNIEQLKAIFLGLPTEIKSSPAVIKAKDGRKAELDLQDTPPPAKDDLGGDHIPHQ